MKKNRRKVFMAAGHHTISLGTGRKEFHPKKPRPGLEHYIHEAGRGVLAQIGGGKCVDEGVIGNFMAARFNKQGHLAALIPSIDPDLRWKPCDSGRGRLRLGRAGPDRGHQDRPGRARPRSSSRSASRSRTRSRPSTAPTSSAGPAGTAASARRATPTSSPRSSATGPGPTSRSTAGTRPGGPSPAGTGTPSRTRACATRPRSATTPAPTSRPWPWPSPIPGRSSTTSTSSTAPRCRTARRRSP